MEEEGGTQKGLHLFFGLRERERLNRFFTGFGKLPLAFTDLISKEGHLRMADEGFLDLQDDTEFAATGDDPFKLVGRVFVVIR